MNHDQARELIPRLHATCVPEALSGCWLWQGSTGNSGYGKMRIGHTKDYSAHRMSYMAFVGDIPDGMCVLHKCDVRTCINPSHLFLGTKKENSQDMVRKGRNKSPASLRTHCPQGHEYSGTNINGARICKICNLAAQLRYKQRRKDNGK